MEWDPVYKSWFTSLQVSCIRNVDNVGDILESLCLTFEAVTVSWATAKQLGKIHSISNWLICVDVRGQLAGQVKAAMWFVDVDQFQCGTDDLWPHQYYPWADHTADRSADHARSTLNRHRVVSSIFSLVFLDYFVVCFSFLSVIRLSVSVTLSIFYVPKVSIIVATGSALAAVSVANDSRHSIWPAGIAWCCDWLTRGLTDEPGRGWLFSHHTVLWGRWVIHDGMPYNLIQAPGQGGLKVAKMANFKVCLLRRWYTCNQKTNGELWYSKTISKF